VRHGECEFALSVEQCDDFVHALARGGASAGELRCGVAAARSADLSGEARAFACRSLAPRLGLSEGSLAIVKRERIPVLCAGGALAGADLSLSHHGRFVAFACELEAAALAPRLAS
jgi:hypothetical protein